MRRPSLFGGKNTETGSEERQQMESGKPEPKDAKKESAAAAAAEQTSKPSGPSERQTTIRYLDRADMAETFADSVTGLTFDGQTLRIEFGVTRLDNVQPNAPITGRRYPACRLVLPPTAAIDLINRISQIGAALKKAGVAKAAPS
jgi:hypothetical protein